MDRWINKIWNILLDILGYFSLFVLFKIWSFFKLNIFDKEEDHT